MSAPIVRRIAVVVGVALVVAVAYLCLWPVAAEPVSWAAPTPPGYTGAHAPNTRLAGLKHDRPRGRVRPGAHGDRAGREALCGHDQRRPFCGWSPTAANQEVFANTNGRVLGFDFDAEGRMIAADAMLGLLAIAPDGRVSLLSDRVSAGDPIGYANSVVVAPDGTIYFTDVVHALLSHGLGRHLRSERTRHPRAICERPGAGLRSRDRNDSRRGAWSFLRQRDRPVVRRTHASS